MRHQTDDVTAVIADPGDVVQRTVRVRGGGSLPCGVHVAEDDLPVLLDPLQHIRLRVVVPLTVRDGNPQRTDGRARARERRIGLDRKSTRLNSSHSQISYAV